MTKPRARYQHFMRWAREFMLEPVCSQCGHDGSASRLELSHIKAHDGDARLAFDTDNLQTLCAKCHRQHDIDVQGKRYGWTLGMTAKWGRIKSQEYLGVQETYDIEMDHPTHNFVANGVVVHNSRRYAGEAEAPLNIHMPHLRAPHPKNRQKSLDELPIETQNWFTAKLDAHFRQAEELYHAMLEHGVAKECARAVLPQATETTIYVTNNCRGWLHYICLRSANGTQEEHQLVALKAKEIFRQHFPNVAEALDELNWAL